MCVCVGRLIEQKRTEEDEYEHTGMASVLTACKHSSAGIMGINKLKGAVIFPTSVQSESQADLNPLCASSSIGFSVDLNAGMSLTRTDNSDDAEQCLTVTCLQ